MDTYFFSFKATTITLMSGDSVVDSVIEKFFRRSKLGQQKYGTTLDRNDLSVLDWINHAQEEHMDAILYLEKLKTEITKMNISSSSTINNKNEHTYQHSGSQASPSQFTTNDGSTGHT
jgi:hypothetical protein